MTHTPGPWTYAKAGGTITAYDTTEKDQYTTESDMEAYGGYMIAESAFNPHNAYLIAAAPDLLEALKSVEAAWTGNGDMATAVDEALLAIDKAEGGDK